MNRNNFKGSLILLVAALIWGLAFVAQSGAAELVPPFATNALRSFIAAIVLYILYLVVNRKEKVPFIPKEKENELMDLMRTIINAFNEKYEGIAKAEITFFEKMPMFEKNNDEYMPILFETVAKKIGLKPEISSFHAGAETHIYANKTNAQGERFSPYLIGLATVCNMHSAREYVDYKTMIKGQELLRELFEAHNK